MLFEPIDCMAEEARRNAKACYERMCEYDNQLKQLEWAEEREKKSDKVRKCV